MTNTRQTQITKQSVIRELFEALKELLDDPPSVQKGVCRHCGREYPDIVSGDCPSDDCPSFKARVALEATIPPLDKLFTDIAREHLGISTLTTRNSDSLDFHSIAAWQVKTALAAAFKAGVNAGCPPTEPPHDLPARFDDYEIQPCRRYLDADEPDKSFVESCEAFEADFWTLYGHIPGQGVEAIGDFHARSHAAEIYARITGRSYD